MGIFGDITLEDIRILFEHTGDKNTVNFRVYDRSPNGTVRSENFRDIPAAKFFKALAIAVHNDGTPEYQKDYSDAESIMGDIRWIP